MWCALCADQPGVHSVDAASDHKFVKRIFHVWCRIRLLPKPADIAFILGEKNVRLAVEREEVIAKGIMTCAHHIPPQESK